MHGTTYKNPVTFYLDNVTYAKLEAKRGIAKRATFVEDIITKAFQTE